MLPPDRSFTRRLRPFAAAIAGMLLAVAPLAAQAAAEAAPDALGKQALERYDVRPLAESLLLRPRDAESAVRSIEIEDGGDVLVNGKDFDEKELVAFLGKDGELIRDLLALDADARRAALGFPREQERKESRAERRDRKKKEGVDIEVPIGLPGSHFKVRASGDDRVSFAHSIHLAKGESANDVVCIGCSIDIEGEAAGDAVAVGGSVHVSGRVAGNAVSVGGSVEVEDGAIVEGDGVAVGGAVEVDGSGEVRGHNTTVGVGGPFFGGWRHGLRFPWGAFGDTGRLVTAVLRTGFLALLGVLAVMLLRPAVDLAARRVGAEPWKAAFAGLLTQLLFLPVLILAIVVLAVSIIGIPLLVLVPFAILAMIVATFVGFVGVAKVLGGVIERRFNWSASSLAMMVIVGVVAIQATSLVGRALSLPGGWLAITGFTLVGLGFFFKYVAWTIGLGSMTLAALAGEWRRPAAAPVATPPPPPPIEPRAVSPVPIETPPAAEPKPEPGDESPQT
jgi:hypothetical protein